MKTRVVRRWNEPQAKAVYDVEKLGQRLQERTTVTTVGTQYHYETVPDWVNVTTCETRDEAESLAAKLADNLPCEPAVVAEFGTATPPKGTP